MRIIVGISGASGAVYGVELLRRLQSLAQHEVHLVVSEYGWKILEHECGIAQKDLAPLVHDIHDENNLGAPIASGSFRCDVMAIAPCSMRTLAAVASGLAGNLLCRAADVMLKEKKPLVVVPRETPFSAIHLENMLKLARLGVSVVPACPGFYHHPDSIEALIGMMTGRIMDAMGVVHDSIPRWQGMDGA